MKIYSPYPTREDHPHTSAAQRFGYWIGDNSALLAVAGITIVSIAWGLAA